MPWNFGAARTVRDHPAGLPQAPRRRRSGARFFGLLAAAAAAGVSSAADSQAVADPREAIWIEGENAARRDVVDHPWYGRQVKLDILSGRAWISHFDSARPGWAEFDFPVAVAGDYTLWVRSNPLLARLSWSLDGGPLREVDFSADQRGRQNIAADNKPDLRFLAWAKVSSVPLSVGPHVMRFEFGSGNSHHGGIDCFLLTRVPFAPQGTLQPSSLREGSGPDEWFPLMADDDPFSPESVIDMSRLIDAPAGKSGRVVAKGKDLVFEGSADRAVKLWGVNANLQPGRYTRAQLTRRARYLRKFGVNIVRQHTVFDDVTTDGRLDPAKLEEYDWWFAELKKHGIYSQWSIFYHVPLTREAAAAAGIEALFDELPAMGGDARLRDTYGLATAIPEYIELRLPFVRQLLAHRNPHTGMTYASDPALAVVEMQNEDSIFFWNPLGALAEGKKWPRHSQRLRKAFHAWALGRYQSRESAEAAWGGPLAGDDWEGGELALAGPWEMAPAGPRGKWNGRLARAGDFTRFLAAHQKSIFESWLGAVREAGFSGVTVTTNWLAGSAAQDPANIFTDTVADLIDRHNYAGGGAGVHDIHEGNIFADSHLADPGAHLFMIGLKQVAGKPFGLSEWTMGPPNQWKLEAAPIMAFYGMGLQGWDVSEHFAQSGWRLGDGWPGQRTYASDTPHYLGQFPALAFALHRGHLAEAPVVAERTIGDSSLFSGRAPLRQDYYDGEDLRRVEDGTPKEVFAVGPVTISFAGQDAPPKHDFERFMDAGKRVIRSATGELSWDYGRETITVESAKTQAVIGRPAGRSIDLPAVSLDIKTPFVSLIFTPLDDAVLAESRHILVTALARDRQSGARYSRDGTKLEAVGTAPLELEPVQADLRFRGSKPRDVRPLDPHGDRLQTVVPVRPDGSFTIDGTYRAYYYEVKR